MSNLHQAITKLQQHEFWAYATDSAAPQDVYTIKTSDKTLLIVGSEHQGVKPILQKTADYTVKIPNRGTIKVSMLQLQRVIYC